MKKIFLKILSLFSFMYMFMFNVNAVDKQKESNHISIAMATDNNYAYPTIVAMTSILENKNLETKIDFYIMLSGDFDPSLKSKIESLKNKYECSISFIDMKNKEDKLKNLYLCRNFTTAIYYRLLLPYILPNLDKVLYMDVDTITQYDFSDLFNINIDNYYLAGVTDNDAWGKSYALYNNDMFVKRFGGKENLEKKYVNSGILLFNLKKMREDDLVNVLIDCASSHKFHSPDQDTLNFVCYNKIKIIDKIFNCRPAKINRLEDQFIIHYSGPKPWNNPNMKFAGIWWNYAKKTRLEKEIKKKFPDKSKENKKIQKQSKIKKKINKAA